MSLDIKKGLIMAFKVGKPSMQFFVQESVAHSFPPYSMCVYLICKASAAIPKPPSSPQVKHVGWADHVELVILKVALK